jgi:hypothetical protein
MHHWPLAGCQKATGGADTVTSTTEAEIASIADELAHNSALPRTGHDVALKSTHRVQSSTGCHLNGFASFSGFEF